MLLKVKATSSHQFEGSLSYTSANNNKRNGNVENILHRPGVAVHAFNPRN